MFEGQRLSNSNIEKYAGWPILHRPKIVPGVRSLLQKDSEFSCLTAIINWMQPRTNIRDVYETVEGLKGIQFKTLYQNAINHFGLHKKVHAKYLKKIGYNWELIKKEINEFQPIILKLWKDGRNFYKNQTVLVVGYVEIAEKNFLAVYDNQEYKIGYIDYDKLSLISSIYYIEND